MKNKFFMGSWIIYFGFTFCVVVGCGVYLGCAIGLENFFDNMGLAIYITIMLVVLPIALFIWCILFFGSIIQINEKGITKSLFGIKQKVFLWEEIDHIKFSGNIMASAVTFYKERGEKSRMSRFSKYERIEFLLDDNRLKVINYYVPEKIKEQMQNPIINKF